MPDLSVGALAAVAAGELDDGRVASFRKLQREAAHEARRREPLLRKSERSRWKSQIKTARANDKRKQR